MCLFSKAEMTNEVDKLRAMLAAGGSGARKSKVKHDGGVKRATQLLNAFKGVDAEAEAVYGTHTLITIHDLMNYYCMLLFVHQCQMRWCS